MAMKKINIDHSTWYSDYVLMFSKCMDKGAKENISQLTAYLHCVYSDKVLHTMAPDSANKVQQSRWNNFKKLSYIQP